MLSLSFLLPIVIASWFIIKDKSISRFAGSSSGEVSIAMKLSILLTIILPVFKMISMMFINAFKRYSEFQADAFVVKMGSGKEFFNFLSRISNLSIGSKNKIYSLMYEDHPWASERVEKMKKIMNF